MLLRTSLKTIVTKHAFCHLQTQIHSAEQQRPHTHTKDRGRVELCVRSTSQAGKTSEKGLCSSKLLLNELIHHWYAKSCFKGKKKQLGWGGKGRAKTIWEWETSEIWCHFFFLSSKKLIISARSGHHLNYQLYWRTQIHKLGAWNHKMSMYTQH